MGSTPCKRPNPSLSAIPLISCELSVSQCASPPLPLRCGVATFIRESRIANVEWNDRAKAAGPLRGAQACCGWVASCSVFSPRDRVPRWTPKTLLGGYLKGSSALLVVDSRRALGLVIEIGLMSATTPVAITSGTSQQRRLHVHLLANL